MGEIEFRKKLARQQVEGIMSLDDEFSSDEIEMTNQTTANKFPCCMLMRKIHIMLTNRTGSTQESKIC